MVTPSMPTCAPVECDIRDYTGQFRTVESYGRKKRWTADRDETAALAPLDRQRRMAAEPEELLVIKTLKIVDKIGRRRGGGGPSSPAREEQEVPRRPETEVRRPLGGGAGLGRSPAVSVPERGVFGEFEVIGDGAEGIGERCVDETTLIAGAVIFLVAQVRTRLLF